MNKIITKNIAQPVSGQNRLDARLERNLFRHRLEGHTSFDPNCEQCVAARGVKHHRKRHADGTETCEIFLDFCFLDVPGRDQVKVLVMVEPVTSTVAYVHVGENVEKTVSEITKFFNYVGFGGASTNVRVFVRVDNDQSLARLFRMSGAVCEKAAPQSHEAIGHAERRVRTLKEHLAAIRLELQSKGLDIHFTAEGTVSILQYISWTENVFKCPFGGTKTAHE